MKKIRIKLSSSCLCYGFGPGQWSHCTLEIKEVWKQNQKSTDSKQLAREQDFWGTWNAVHLDLLCQNRPLGLQHSLVIICQTELSSSQSALPTRSVHAVMFETVKVLSLIHLNYCYNFSTLCWNWCRGKNNGNCGQSVSTTRRSHCLTSKNQVDTCKIQWVNKFLVSSLLNDF